MKIHYIFFMMMSLTFVSLLGMSKTAELDREISNYLSQQSSPHSDVSSRSPMSKVHIDRDVLSKLNDAVHELQKKQHELELEQAQEAVENSKALYQLKARIDHHEQKLDDHGKRINELLKRH